MKEEILKLIDKVENQPINNKQIRIALKDGFGVTAIWSLGYLEACIRMKKQIERLKPKHNIRKKKGSRKTINWY